MANRLFENTAPQTFSVGDTTMQLVAPEHVFQPNLTTQLLGEAMQFRPGAVVADVGCGSGPIAILAALRGAGKVYAVDLQPDAVECVRINARLNGVEDIVEARQGSLFEPLKGLRFDCIVDDVSGIAEEVCRMSPWYPEPIPLGSGDGTEPTLSMLEQARNYLTEKGHLYFPLLSLANAQKIMATAHSVYGDCMEMVSEKFVPFCREFMANLARLEELQREGLVDFCQRRSRFFWSLRIYRAGTQ